jgi:hypothetical protein
MINTILKQLALLTISATGFYFSGLNLVAMTHIKSLLDGLNVMIFFTCFFPCFFLSLNLFLETVKYFLKLAGMGMPHFKSMN